MHGEARFMIVASLVCAVIAVLVIIWNFGSWWGRRQVRKQQRQVSDG